MKGLMQILTSGVTFKISALVFLQAMIAAQPVISQDKKLEIRSINLQLRGVYDSKVTLTPFFQGRYQNPLVEVSDVKGELKMNVPANYLPGQFLIRMDYRKKAEDQPYPSEFIFYMNDQDLDLGINPLAIYPDSIYFGNDTENPVFFKFGRENEIRRQQLIMLEQLLTVYDTRNSKFYKMAEIEFENRLLQYNGWISSQKSENSKLFVSHIFDFQKAIPIRWDLPDLQRSEEQVLHYFDEIDLNDTLIVKTQALENFLSRYMGLLGLRATTEKLRDSLFVEAGRIACEKTSSGHPKVYGWMVDYFYRGYESYNISSGIAMLQKFISDPRCLTSKRQEILKRLEGMQKMKKGTVAQGFEAEMFDGMKLRFDGISKQKKYELVVFYESDCSHCKELLKELAQWYSIPENKVWFEVITVAMDDDRKIWEQSYTKNKFDWYDVWAPGGVNSKVANDYYILSTPVIYIIDKEMKIAATPDNLKGIESFLNE